MATTITLDLDHITPAAAKAVIKALQVFASMDGTTPVIEAARPIPTSPLLTPDVVAVPTPASASIPQVAEGAFLPEPAKPKRGRPVKQTPVIEAPVPEPLVQGTPATLDAEALQNALLVLTDAKGIGAGRDLLASYGAVRVSDLLSKDEAVKAAFVSDCHA